MYQPNYLLFKFWLHAVKESPQYIPWISFIKTIKRQYEGIATVSDLLICSSDWLLAILSFNYLLEQRREVWETGNGRVLGAILATQTKPLALSRFHSCPWGVQGHVFRVRAREEVLSRSRWNFLRQTGFSPASGFAHILSTAALLLNHSWCVLSGPRMVLTIPNIDVSYFKDHQRGC